jgi:lipopolysaccharide export system protein LptA
VKHILILSAALGAAASFAQSDNLRLDTPLLGKTETGLDSSITPHRPLGYEGTPIAAKKGEEVKKAKGQTEITSLEATFDQKGMVAVFLREVVVKDPEFTVNCDRLTAYLKKAKNGAERPAATPAPENRAPASPPPANPPPANPLPGKSADDPKGGGLDHAIAEADPGNVVIITQDKVESDGSITKNIGKGRKVTYDSATGNIVLTGMPNIQQGINLFVATDESTVMTLNRNGHVTFAGPTKTILKDTSSENAR